MKTKSIVMSLSWSERSDTEKGKSYLLRWAESLLVETSSMEFFNGVERWENEEAETWTRDHGGDGKTVPVSRIRW